MSDTQFKSRCCHPQESLVSASKYIASKRVALVLRWLYGVLQLFNIRNVLSSFKCVKKLNFKFADFKLHT